MTEPELIPPSKIYETLMQREWNEARMGSQTFALICPLCGSFVATSRPPNGITYRDVHSRDHAAVAGYSVQK